MDDKSKCDEEVSILKIIGNQRWNLKRFETQAEHMRWGHVQIYMGVGYSYWRMAYPLMSTPTWFKWGIFYATLHSFNE